MRSSDYAEARGAKGAKRTGAAGAEGEEDAARAPRFSSSASGPGLLSASASGEGADGGSFGRDASEADTERHEPEVERRRDARVALGVAARAQRQKEEMVGTLENLSISGAHLRTQGTAVPPAGAGLEVTFRLPTGPQLRLSSTVRWSSRDDVADQSSCGLQFLEVSGANRAYLEHYVELAAASAGVEGVRAEVVHKYQLSFDASGRAQAILGGMLSREEAQAFSKLLKERIAPRKSGRVHFAIDARRLSVCSQDVVLELRGCFDLIAQSPEVVGLLIGNKSLALTQLVRAARDAGIADHVFCVNEPEEACRIWDKMDG